MPLEYTTLLFVDPVGVLVVKVPTHGLGTKDLDGKPLVTDLEPVSRAVELVHLIIAQLDSVNLLVVNDSGRSDRLGDHRNVLALTPLQVPNQQCLLGSGVVLFSNRLQSLVVSQGGVGGSKT